MRWPWSKKKEEKKIGSKRDPIQVMLTRDVVNLYQTAEIFEGGVFVADAPLGVHRVQFFPGAGAGVMGFIRTRAKIVVGNGKTRAWEGPISALTATPIFKFPILLDKGESFAIYTEEPFDFEWGVWIAYCTRHERVALPKAATP